MRPSIFEFVATLFLLCFLTQADASAISKSMTKIQAYIDPFVTKTCRIPSPSNDESFPCSTANSAQEEWLPGSCQDCNNDSVTESTTRAPSPQMSGLKPVDYLLSAFNQVKTVAQHIYRMNTVSFFQTRIVNGFAEVATNDTALTPSEAVDFIEFCKMLNRTGVKPKGDEVHCPNFNARIIVLSQPKANKTLLPLVDPESRPGVLTWKTGVYDDGAQFRYLAGSERTPRVAYFQEATGKSDTVEFKTTLALLKSTIGTEAEQQLLDVYFHNKWSEDNEEQDQFQKVETKQTKVEHTKAEQTKTKQTKTKQTKTNQARTKQTKTKQTKTKQTKTKQAKAKQTEVKEPWKLTNLLSYLIGFFSVEMLSMSDVLSIMLNLAFLSQIESLIKRAKRFMSWLGW